MKACNDLDFLTNYWIEAKKIGDKIIEELPLGTKSNTKVDLINRDSGVKMYTVNFKDLPNSWSVTDILHTKGGKSETLIALAEKINNMILRNRSKDIKPMLKRILNKGVKNLKQPGLSEQEWKLQPDGINEKLVNLGNIGKGHFRWNWQAYTLNTHELKRIKDYFKL